MLWILNKPRRFICYKIEKQKPKHERIYKNVTKKYSSKHGLVGNMINRELGKGFKFDNTDKWYRYKSEPVVENDLLKIFFDVDTKVGHEITTKEVD